MPERADLLDRTRFFARQAAAALRGRRPPFALCYHGVGTIPESENAHGLFVSAELFAAHLDALLARGYRLVTVEELWDAVARGGGAAEGLGAITFDDGLADTLHVAADLLRERGATATAFLAPGLFGADHPDLPVPRRIVRGDELAGLEASGIVVGAHSVDHVDLRRMEREAAIDELRRSRTELEAILGHPVTTMAYPFGEYSEETIELAREAGFEVACACAGAAPWRPLALPREPVFPSTSPRRLQVKAAGLYFPFQSLSLGLAHLRGAEPRRT